MRPNRVKQLLRAGQSAIGTWLSLGSPLAAEWLGHQGFDWLNVEQEHGAIDATLTQYLLQAISATEAVPLVRVPWNDPAYIKRALDAGAYGLVIPMVNSREEAARAVRASKYPPLGDRSLGGARPRLYGGPDYVKHANDEVLLVVQIEHVRAVRAAREILSVEGVDAYFVGPNDLAMSMGLEPSLDPRHPEFEAALDEVLAIARELGVPAGIHVPSAEAANRRIAQGYQFISISSDGGFMAQAARAELERVERGATAAPRPVERPSGQPAY